MKTLVRILKTLDGTEYWFRIEGMNTFEIEFVGGK